MKPFKRLLPPVLMLLSVACSESTTPTISGPDQMTEAGPALQGHLTWDRPESLQYLTARVGTPAGEFELVKGDVLFDGGVAASGEYQVSFWAVNGEDRYVKINLENMPVLTFEVPAGALLARSGSKIAKGDSVLITVGIDDTNLAVHMSPSGLQFHPKEPAILTMWYEMASGDFNGDGVIDEADWDIEATQLGMWYQQSDYDDWSPIQSQVTTEQKRVMSPLYHFSGYAVSW